MVGAVETKAAKFAHAYAISVLDENGIERRDAWCLDPEVRWFMEALIGLVPHLFYFLDLDSPATYMTACALSEDVVAVEREGKTGFAATEASLAQVVATAAAEAEKFAATKGAPSDHFYPMSKALLGRYRA
jgi:hypothetical protein